MSTVVLRRQPRREAPELPSGEVVLDPPPEIPTGGRRWGQVLMMLPMLAGAGAMALLFTQGRGGPLGYVAGGLLGVSALGMVAMGLVNAGGSGKRQLAEDRRAYMRHLALQRRSVRRTAQAQREAMLYRHPEPDQLWVTAASHRLWERRREHADFGVVRIGRGPQALATPVVPPQTRPLDELEPLCASALRRFVLTYSVVPELPVAMAVNGFGRVHVLGPPARRRALARAVVAQLAVHHSPDDLLVAVAAGTEERAGWEWTKWLPHGQHPERTDALGRLRLVSPTVPALEALLDDFLAVRPRFDPSGSGVPVPGPHVVVVLDGGEVAGSSHLMTDGGVEGVTVLDLSTPPPRLLDRGTLVLEVDDDGTLRSRTTDGTAEIGRADELAGPLAESLARQLAPFRLSAGSRGGDAALSTATGLADLLDIADPYGYDVEQGWAPRPNRDRLRVPIGVGPDGAPVELDLKESAQDGMGPHGLLVGATGAGKSELLRTLVLALAVTHDSETLNFVLVDFKGGATFTKLDRLPHTSAVITNLADELPLVDRMVDAINGELLRRQELLRSAGNYSSLRDYERARTSGVPLPPVPTLLIICDEFSELLSAKPDFIDLFVQIGRVGRSLGVHLLLASQRLEEGRLRGLDTHLSYRIGLRTNSAMESRVVLAAPDAFELPRAPGHGFMKYGTDPLERFRAAYVSGTYKRPTERREVGAAAGPVVHTYDTQYLAPPVPATPAEGEAEPAPDEGSAVGESLLDVLVDRMEGRGTPAHQVWLPPLAEPPSLDQLLPPLVEHPDRGTTVDAPDQWGGLRVTVGVVDKPADQRRDPLVLDLSGAGGHVAVVGGPQSGKSTALRSLVASLALTHTPREVQVYGLDFGGGTLAGLRELPHVGSVAARSDTDQVRRTVAELQTLLARRELAFAHQGVDGMATYRRRLRSGQVADDPYGDVFLVVDGWLTVRNDFEDIEAAVTDLAGRGLSYGIHVVVSAGRWLDLRPAIRDLFGTRLELRLGDPGDSLLDRRTAVNVPAETPGRGITADKLHVLTALPRIDGEQGTEDLADGVAGLVDAVKARWHGPVAPGVRLLPALVEHGQLLADPNRGIAIGIAEGDLSTVHLDMQVEPHLVVFGDAECGKSTFLRSFVRRVTDQWTPYHVRVLTIDFRRSLLGAVSEEHSIGYATSAPTAREMVAEVAQVMQGRLPGPDVTPAQLRDRSWWDGPELYLVVDDYDLVAAASPNPLTPLLEFLAQGRDVGLHLVLTRRSGGANRALFEPVLQRLRELATPGIVMDGDKGEGALVGAVKPGPQPPGRGWLVTRRRGTELVQLAWLPPEL
ncbi:type VII secretion protein EccCa [Klenkia sp. PcliD-1-E]|uniref:type VII secretion protein EccCa n=1 Tax=Klenkia sp. PcliD-1-E TaxID=2954492 RepID=UPI002097430B|nr:type VII secretion protein EccCa [Klenkia sp. PcliD-1-E]MCO7222087.1 type VII secretion protein EccCa [Klenkia sp. PcliD-1-E]